MKIWQKVFWILYPICAYYVMFNYVFWRINWITIIFSTIAIVISCFFIWIGYEEFVETSLGIYIKRLFESEDEKEKRLKKEKRVEAKEIARRQREEELRKAENKKQIPKLNKELSYLNTKLKNLDEEEIYINYDPEARRSLQNEKALIHKRIEYLKNTINYYEKGV